MKKRFALSVVVLVAWMAIIFYISSLPNEQLAPEKDAVGVSIPQSVKHIAEFGVLGFLACMVAMQISETFPSLFGSSMFSIAYGILDEIHQAYVPTRICTLFDMWTNGFGCIFGIMAYLVLLKVYRANFKYR